MAGTGEKSSRKLESKRSPFVLIIYGVLPGCLLIAVIYVFTWEFENVCDGIKADSWISWPRCDGMCRAMNGCLMLFFKNLMFNFLSW